MSVDELPHEYLRRRASEALGWLGPRLTPAGTLETFAYCDAITLVCELLVLGYPNVDASAVDRRDGLAMLVKYFGRSEGKQGPRTLLPPDMALALPAAHWDKDKAEWVGREWVVVPHMPAMQRLCSDVGAVETLRRALRLMAGHESTATSAAGGAAAGRDDEGTHSPDFRSVRWFGTEYVFTKAQAVIVGVLWNAWETGTPDVGSETLLEAADSKTSRLVDIFRDSDAWGTMIVDGATKGSKRLAEPTNTRYVFTALP